MEQDRHRDASIDDLIRLDQEQALQHRLERLGASAPRRLGKDDRRSSERLTASERNERWPIG